MVNGKYAQYFSFTISRVETESNPLLQNIFCYIKASYQPPEVSCCVAAWGSRGCPPGNAQPQRTPRDSDVTMIREPLRLVQQHPLCAAKRDL